MSVGPVLSQQIFRRGEKINDWTAARFHYLDPPHFPDGMVHHEHGIVIVSEPADLPVLALDMLMAWRKQWSR